MQEPSVADIEEKLKEIYDDLADNVTNIYGRQDLHLILDLVYHAPLRFRYDNKLVKKGYPEILVIGDTRTGKTQCAEALQAHYGVGVAAGGESCSFAGLVGGLQQLGKNWTCTWGVIPQNNRRLVIIDEASGMKKEDIAAMSSVRSQGKAKVTKIQTQETEAWTRLIWLSNPREQQTVNQFSSGVDIVESLIPSPEDIARWDAIMIVSKDEIPFSSMATSRRGSVEHKMTSELCRNLVLWSWTREVDEIKLTEEAEDTCYVLALKMVEKYCSDFTLVNPAEQRIKLARLGTALAARLYSTDDGKNLIVHKSHITYIYEFLNRIYDSPYFRYDSWSTNQTKGAVLIDRDELIAMCVGFTPQGCGQFADLKNIRLKDIGELLGISDDEAKSKLSRMILNNAIVRSKGDYYHKNPEFQALLREHSELPYTKKDKEF